MIELYAGMGALTLATVVWLLRPWWVARRDGHAMRREANVSAYRQRLDEIESESVAGLMTADAAQALRDEAGARLVDDAANLQAEPAAAVAGRSWGVIAVFGLLLAVFSAGFYYLSGSWRTAAMVAGEIEPTAESQAAEVDTMLAQLAQRLQDNPDDVDGWAMLGRSNFMLQRYQLAADAYGKANELTGRQNADLLVAEGESLGLARQRDLQGRPRQLFDQALSLDSDHAKALWYAGMSALQAGERARTVELWTRLRQQPLPDQLRAAIDEQLVALGAPVLTETPVDGPAAATPQAVALNISLSLAPELASKLPEGAMLIVYAKALSGPPMPLAVVRQPAGDFPVSVTLDDSLAMMPTLKLSQFDRWEVTARISRSGQAKAESGDLQGVIELGRQDAGRVIDLTIDQIVP
jgi:cytochrome c-type biogenesis protein CcmH